MEIMGVVSADKGFQFLDQFPGFIFRDEFGRLDSVNKQLQLQQLKGPCDKVVPIQMFVLTPDDVQTIAFQCFKFGIQSLAVRGEPLLLES